MTVRLGVVGLGNWGKAHAEMYATHPRGTLEAVCDLNEALAKEIAESYDVKKVYTDFHDLMADPEIDAVSIVTPDFSHREPVECAARAGKHILLEKPLATNVEDAKSIVDAVKAAGVKVMVDFHNRWNPAICSVKQALEKDELGYPVSAYIRLHDTIFVPTGLLSWAGQSSSLWFLGSHCLDLLRWLLDDEVETVYAVSGSRVVKALGVDTPDLYTAVLKFRNGATAVMENNWIMPVSQPTKIDFKLDLFCSEGQMNLDMSHHRAVQKYTKEAATYPAVLITAQIHGRKQGFIYDSIRYFVDCIADDRDPCVGIMDGYINTVVLAAIERSAATGEVVQV